MNLKNINAKRKSQTQKVTYRMIPFYEIVKTDKSLEIECRLAAAKCQ